MKKAVSFDESKNKVHLMVAWSFAYKRSRMMPQEFIEKHHFNRRIEKCQLILEPILDSIHRDTVFKKKIDLL